ncbi:MAG: ribosome small subunit-dependent GTPase A [Clostridiales bacterium]|nr:ribosome small subunit-dependent GTPase A [Clostridiales bacterium]
MEGLIIRGIGGLYTLDTPSGTIDARARGIFRHENLRLIPGDRVTYEMLPDGTAVITELIPRRNMLIRPSAANLDVLVVIASAAPPATEFYLIDRVFAVAACKGIEQLLCVNKCDLDPGDELVDVYTRADIPTLQVCAETGDGISALAQRLQGKISALTGNSGVGKSSILQKMLPDRTLQVGELSEKLGRGKHTTRSTELYALPEGGYIADTPGFSEFDVSRLFTMLREDVWHGFPEFAPYVGYCRYTGCLHTHEDGCMVREAVARGDIPASRHESYVRLCDELKDTRAWMLKDKP